MGNAMTMDIPGSTGVISKEEEVSPVTGGGFVISGSFSALDTERGTPTRGSWGILASWIASGSMSCLKDAGGRDPEGRRALELKADTPEPPDSAEAERG